MVGPTQPRERICLGRGGGGPGVGIGVWVGVDVAWVEAKRARLLGAWGRARCRQTMQLVVPEQGVAFTAGTGPNGGPIALPL